MKVVEEKFKFLCFSSLPSIRHADPPGNGGDPQSGYLVHTVRESNSKLGSKFHRKWSDLPFCSFSLQSKDERGEVVDRSNRCGQKEGVSPCLRVLPHLNEHIYKIIAMKIITCALLWRET